jgi:class 3 adenylate cyclase
MFWFCFICDLSVFLYEGLQRAEFSARRELEVAYQTLAVERERSERLLLNILPRAIAERLKQDNHIIADQFPEATVLFADIVGFTQLSSQISATELVVLLNQMFSIFDQLTEQHGAEKIKTIGDAYMVVAGLPTPRSDHAQAIANLALDMQQAIARFNIEQSQAFSIRIGINTGPVVAGVIGLKRFIYDLWGDTVNIASRMESHGLAGGIQVSEATYECLKEQYLFERRGRIQVKGKGEMLTYLLTGKQSLSMIST